MALVVTPGSATADSYISVADADAYHFKMGNTAWESADAIAKEEALRRGTRYIDARYRYRWRGQRTSGRDQALEWPRAYATGSLYPSYRYWGDWPATNLTIEDDELPVELKNATAEAALREVVAPGSLTPDVTMSERVRSESIGPISTTYFDDYSVGATRPIITLIDEMLAPLLVPVRLTGTLVRA